jgi:hydrogenase maturation protease
MVLPDFAEIAPASPGDLDGDTDADEISSPRVVTTTGAETREMRDVDERVRDMRERTESLTPEDFARMHGIMRPPASARLCDGSEVCVGSRVRLRPRRRADVMDPAIAGRDAVVEAIEQDAEGCLHLAVALLDEPDRDLGFTRQAGHRHFFRPDDLETDVASAMAKAVEVRS